MLVLPFYLSIMKDIMPVIQFFFFKKKKKRKSYFSLEEVETYQ